MYSFNYQFELFKCFIFEPMTNKYISIKEACELFNKSLSTIRRVVKEIPTNKLKYEKLPTGKNKIFIEREYLNEYFNEKKQSNDSLNSQVNDSLNNSNEQLLIKTYQSIIKTLNDELENKNKQINSLVENNRDTQKELNTIINNMTNKLALETKEVNEVRRKWWQRNK